MKHITEVIVKTDLPGIKAGTVLRKPLSGGYINDFMSPECISEEGEYIPSQSFLHWSQSTVEKYPDFFEAVPCGCKCADCGGCECMHK
jgi:hypothetical protein